MAAAAIDAGTLAAAARAAAVWPSVRLSHDGLSLCSLNVLAPVYKTMGGSRLAFRYESENVDQWTARHKALADMLVHDIVCLQEFWFHEPFAALYTQHPRLKNHTWLFTQRPGAKQDGLAMGVAQPFRVREYNLL